MARSGSSLRLEPSASKREPSVFMIGCAVFLSWWGSASNDQSRATLRPLNPTVRRSPHQPRAEGPRRTGTHPQIRARPELYAQRGGEVHRQLRREHEADALQRLRKSIYPTTVTRKTDARRSAPIHDRPRRVPGRTRIRMPNVRITEWAPSRRCKDAFHLRILRTAIRCDWRYRRSGLFGRDDNQLGAFRSPLRYSNSKPPCTSMF